MGYELCSAVCHYGEAPEAGSYKALARDGISSSSVAPMAGGSPQTGASGSGSFVAGSGDWYVFDDTAVRWKSAEEMISVIQCEGYHTCFLMYRREDTKTINMRPH